MADTHRHIPASSRAARLKSAGYLWAALAGLVLAGGILLGGLAGLVLAAEVVSLVLLAVMMWIGVGN